MVRIEAGFAQDRSPAQYQIFMIACTIVARNYLAQAQVLARSFREHHPHARFAILLIDSLRGEKPHVAGVDILQLEEMGLERGDAHRMALIYNVTELSTAVKPWLLRHLLREGNGPVIYFDPDIELFAPVDRLAQLAEEHSIVLTPHVTEPMPRDGMRLRETDILASGIYNLGFIAIGPGSEPFLDFWSVRLRRECVIDPPNMRFTDQRWVDFVPGLYPHFILRDPTCNVAYWNLYSRFLSWTGSGYEVNGQPLTFFHFSGYDPEHPHILSKHQGLEPRIRLSERPDVLRICNDYAGKLSAQGFSAAKRQPYGFGQLQNGVRIDHAIRRLYRETLELFEVGKGDEPPDPFAPGGETAFVEWLNQPVMSSRSPITRYMMAVHATRSDLQREFPDPSAVHARAYWNWFLERGAHEMQVAELLIPAGALHQRNGKSGATYIDHDETEPRVNVVGYLAAELGVGEAARRITSALDASATPYNTIANRETLNRQSHPHDDRQSDSAPSDINILCINADETPGFVERTGPAFFDGRYSVGVWFWEVEKFPSFLHGAFEVVDEVWVATDFIRRTLLEVSPKPVFKFPLPITVPAVDRSLSRKALGLSDRFTFLFSFDFMSVFERKNPLAVIKAFQKAFEPGSGPALLIKTINGDKKVLDVEKLRFATVGHPDIKVVDGYLSPVAKNTLTAHCDCYVSLHRSEGYGLTMAEAMALGKPVIATEYSGNLDFMTRENSFLCSYRMVEIGEDSAPYPPRARWAEPAIDEAASLMRQVYDDPALAKSRGARAAEDVLRLHSPTVAGKAIRARIEAIRAQRSGLVGAEVNRYGARVLVA